MLNQQYPHHDKNHWTTTDYKVIGIILLCYLELNSYHKEFVYSGIRAILKGSWTCLKAGAHLIISF